MKYYGPAAVLDKKALQKKEDEVELALYEVAVNSPDFKAFDAKHQINIVLNDKRVVFMYPSASPTWAYYMSVVDVIEDHNTYCNVPVRSGRITLGFVILGVFAEHLKDCTFEVRECEPYNAPPWESTYHEAKLVNKNKDEAAPVLGGVYLLRVNFKTETYYKIGMTARFEKRIKTLSTQLPYPTEEVHRICSQSPAIAEAHWHQKFASKRCPSGEWFELSGEDVAEFKSKSIM
jgi:hypothetical protein